MPFLPLSGSHKPSREPPGSPPDLTIRSRGGACNYGMLFAAFAVNCQKGQPGQIGSSGEFQILVLRPFVFRNERAAAKTSGRNLIHPLDFIQDGIGDF